MSAEERVGTVRNNCPHARSESPDRTSASTDPEVGTVGTVSSYCTRRARGNDNERARGDFPENGPELSPTVPTSQTELALEPEKGHWWDVHANAFPFGVGRRIDRVQALTRADAEALAYAKHGRRVQVFMTSKAKAKDSLRRPLHRGNSPRGKRP